MATLLRQAATWHRPMLLCAGLMGVMTVVSLTGLAVDDRILTGAPIWSKPFKFAVSIALYMVTWAWLYTLVPANRRRLANGISNVLVAIMVVEYGIIVAQVLRGRASHFNVATPLDSALFSTMGISITALWVLTFVLSLFLLRAKIADAASRWAIRLGMFLSLAGAGIGPLMTQPTDAQLAAMRNDTFDGVVGAHSVGVADGGPSMPLTGWSTTGGDLRVPHFIGLHALQLLPVLALLLGLLATRFVRLRPDAVRGRLMLVAGGAYAALFGLVTWQALRGEPLVAPGGMTLAALGAIAVATAVGITWALTHVSSDHDAVPSHHDAAPSDHDAVPSHSETDFAETLMTGATKVGDPR